MFQNVCFRFNTKINKEYYILDDRLSEINTVGDIGLVFQSNLIFSHHINQTFSKTLRSLSF